MITADDTTTTPETRSEASPLTSPEMSTDTSVMPLPAFTDNYLWLIVRGRQAVVVDPGDGAVVQAALEARGLTLAAILVTHHHPDHVGGVSLLAPAFDGPVYGPRAESGKIIGLTHLLDDGDRVSLAAVGLDLHVIAVPGHTLGHIAYFADRQGDRAPWLFCGDTLFAAGCGRLFEGTPGQMHDSLSRLAALPADSVVFCAHEYTLANLDFARTVEPHNQAIADEIERVQSLRARAVPSVPSNLLRERATNPFLRCAEPAVIAAAQRQAGHRADNPVDIFATLRFWKDGHRPTLR